MLILNIFSRMHRAIRHKVTAQEPGLYVSLLFPIAVAFLLTFISARVVNHLWPQLFLTVSGVHIHHFAYGFFVLAASGYLALIFNGPHGKYLISLLYGFGLGLAFDEFGMWLRLKDDDPIRWSYDGFFVVLGIISLIISAKPGVKMLKKLWLFRG